MIRTNIIRLPNASGFSEIPEPASKIVEMASSDISSTASNAVAATQKGLIDAKSKVLDIYSDACRFFGVDHPINIIKQFKNNTKLIELKCKHNKIRERFPTGTYLSVDEPNSIDSTWNRIWSGYYGKQFEYLYEGPARMTFSSKLFGNNGEEGFHTIGILYHPESETLYILDSLPNSFKEVKEYQKILEREVFYSDYSPIKNIIFSNKPQQNPNEFTCNNWSLANIEALQKALKEGKTIDTVEKLNEILPDNINKILKEQQEFVLKNS